MKIRIQIGCDLTYGAQLMDDPRVEKLREDYDFSFSCHEAKEDIRSMFGLYDDEEYGAGGYTREEEAEGGGSPGCGCCCEGKSSAVVRG